MKLSAAELAAIRERDVLRLVPDTAGLDRRALLAHIRALGVELAAEQREVAELDAILERIRVAFQALRDGKEHASSNLYRVLATEFPALLAPSDAAPTEGAKHG